MDGMQGMLMVPPDRNQILGRAAWKTRYVVISTLNANDHPVLSQTKSSRSQSNKENSKPKLQPIAGDYYITIFKSKDDSDPIQQYAVSTVTDVQVQMLAHRKQGPILPTLVVIITDKHRKRRSSRATGLMSSKDSGPTSLWFRTPPDDHHPSLHDWAAIILAKKTSAPAPPDAGPASPTLFSGSNPLTSRSRDPSDQPAILGVVGVGGNTNNHRMALNHKTSTTYTRSSRDPDGGHHTTTTSTTFSSDSPSLRSHKSDLSSPSHPAAGAQNPTPIPESASEASGQRIVAAQGRAGAKGRGSVGSGPTSPASVPLAGAQEPGSPPPFQRESILDRAFSLRVIPGSELTVPGEEKLTSLARFDALMRHVDEKRQRKPEERTRGPQPSTERQLLRDTDLDDDSDEADDADDADDAHDGDYDDDEDEQDDASGSSGVDSDEDSDEDSDDQDDEAYHGPLIPPTAQRALEFIAGRRDSNNASTSSRPRNPVSFYQPRPGPVASPTDRPHTAHARNRPSISQRSVSQMSSIQPARNGAEAAAGATNDNTGSSVSSRAVVANSSGGERQSVSGNKRLSFTEFTKRLSSTSSLLLVQSNGSGGSGGSRVSSETDRVEQQSLAPPSRLTGPRPPPRNPARDERCGTWRGSVIGTEGGFL